MPKTIAFVLPDADAELIDDVVDESGLLVSEICRDVVRQWLEENPDGYDCLE